MWRRKLRMRMKRRRMRDTEDDKESRISLCKLPCIKINSLKSPFHAWGLLRTNPSGMRKECDQRRGVSQADVPLFGEREHRRSLRPGLVVGRRGRPTLGVRPRERGFSDVGEPFFYSLWCGCL